MAGPPQSSSTAAAGATAEQKLALNASILSDTSLSAEQKYAKIQEAFRDSLNSPVAPAPAPTSTASANGSLPPEEQMRLITSNLQEVLDPQIMEDILFKEKRPLRIYWGTATTGRPHCAYFVPMLKIASFLRAGCVVTILLADMHGFLDNLKAPIELVQYRAQYYQFVVTELLKAIGVSIERLHFVLGSSYQLSEAYHMDLLKLCTIVTMHDARKAGAEVVKQVENATLSGLIYPLMQGLDEQYLGVDVQFGGVDQRKIFTLAKDVLPKLGYKERAHLMNPMVPGLAGGKMSASDPNSKIDPLDDAATVAAKIKKAKAAPKVVEDNGLLSFAEHVLLPASELRTGKPEFVVETFEGERLVYQNIEQMREDYQADKLNPQNLKGAVAKSLNELLDPVRAAYQASPEWREVEKKAYPPPPPPEKKQKKVKDKGSRHPGAATAQNPAVEAQADGTVEGPDKAQVDLGKDSAAAMKELHLAEKAVEK